MGKETKYIAIGNCGVNIVGQLDVPGNDKFYIYQEDFPLATINELIDCQRAILVGGLGGNHCFEIAPVVAKALKYNKIETLGVFTFPAKFEGEPRRDHARKSMMKLQELLDEMVVVSNNNCPAEKEFVEGLEKVNDRVGDLIDKM